jgi:hypothetical protein
MGRTRKKKNNKKHLVGYLICMIIVFILGYCFKNEYINIDNIQKKLQEITSENKIISIINDLEIENKEDEEQQIQYKSVDGTLEMHIIDVGQR